MIRRRILINHDEKFYLSLVHTDADLDRTLEACEPAFAALAARRPAARA